MKKITVQGILEEAKYYCDKHPEQECFSTMNIASWYGSKFDLLGTEVHLCDECLEEMYGLLEQKFGAKPKDIII